MNYKILNFTQTSQLEWDNLINQISTHGFFHSYDWINYSIAFNDNLLNLSFILNDTANKPLAVVPLCLTITPNGNEFSFNGNYLSSWAIKNIRPSERRAIINDINAIIKNKALELKVGKIKIMFPTVTYDYQKRYSEINIRNVYELQNLGFIYDVSNTNLIELETSSDELLANMSKSQRKIIKKSFDKGISIKVIDSSYMELDLIFAKFQDAHLKSAGKMTRPQKTWDLMKDRIKLNRAKLFVSIFQNVEISYLYCGEHFDYVLGWSQVNISEYEKELSPRQSLEWSAILYYKNLNYKYYEIGETNNHPSLFQNPSDKEKSIGHFKEKFGANWYPKIKAIGYFDQELIRDELSLSISKLLPL